MKKNILVLLFFILISVSITGCNNKKTDSSLSATNKPYKLMYDLENEALNNHDLTYDDYVDKTIDEFPDVVFRCSLQKIIAVKNKEETTLLWLSALKKIYASDLNGDGKPELCVSASNGSGIIECSVVIIDYANEKIYYIAKSMVNDFELSEKNGTLGIIRAPYHMIEDSDQQLYGDFSIENNQIIIKFDNGETLTYGPENLYE